MRPFYVFAVVTADNSVKRGMVRGRRHIVRKGSAGSPPETAYPTWHRQPPPSCCKRGFCMRTTRHAQTVKFNSFMKPFPSSAVSLRRRPCPATFLLRIIMVGIIGSRQYIKFISARSVPVTNFTMVKQIHRADIYHANGACQVKIKTAKITASLDKWRRCYTGKNYKEGCRMKCIVLAALCFPTVISARRLLVFRHWRRACLLMFTGAYPMNECFRHGLPLTGRAVFILPEEKEKWTN